MVNDLPSLCETFYVIVRLRKCYNTPDYQKFNGGKL